MRRNLCGAFCIAVWIIQTIPASSLPMRFSTSLRFIAAISVTLLLVVTQIAGATPPRYVGVHDIPIAINKSHLFLFRNLTDNQGSHYIQHITRFLVSQNLETGKLDQHWPLGTTYQETIEECEKKCAKTSLENAVNPMDILRDNHAVPIQLWPMSKWENPDSDEQLKYPQPGNTYYLNDEGLQNLEEGEPKLVEPAQKLEQRITASIGPTMALMPDEDGPVDPAEYNEYARSKQLAGCVVEGLFANISKHQLYSLICDSDGDHFVARYRVYFTLPDTQ